LKPAVPINCNKIPPTDDDIRQAAQDFRCAIDAAGSEPWERKHMRFPQGACGHASELLGKYLIDRFAIVAEYVNQVAYDDIGGWKHSHAWLEWNGLTIDVSGDQFGWEPVIVTRSPQYLGKGEDENRHAVCLEHQQEWWAQECGSLWQAIRPHLPRG
jgi:hypothetical protein